MKHIIRNTVSATLLFVTIVMLLPGKLCLGSNGELSAKRANAKLAAKLIIGKFHEKGKERQIGIDYLSKKISDNPAGYQKRSDSWNKLQTEEKGTFLGWYKKEVELILKGLNRDKPEEMDDYFTKEQRKAFLKCPEQVVEAYLNKNFGENAEDETTIFSKARKKACSEQEHKLTCNLYPNEIEIDKLVFDKPEFKVDKSARDKLYSDLLNKLITRQKEPVFLPENQIFLGTSFIDPIIDDGIKQLREQRKIVGDPYIGDKVTPEDIKEFIKNRIITYRDNLGERKEKEKIAKEVFVLEKVYEMFTSVENEVNNRGNSLAIERFYKALSSMTLSVDKNAVEELIDSNLSAHATEGESWSICLNRFRRDIQKQAIDIHAKRADRNKQSDFRKFLAGLISNSDQSCKDAMNKLVDRSLKQEFDQVRKEKSEQQFEVFFEPLEQKTWKPSEKEIDKWYNKSVEISESEALKMPNISLKSFDPANLLEETVKLVREAEEARIKTGLKALEKQMNMVEELESQIKSQIRNMSNLTIEKVIKIYTQKVNSSWSSNDYPDLFTRTQKEIRMRAKNILDLEIKRQRRVAIDKAKAADKTRAQLEDKGRSDTLSIEDKKPGTGSQDANISGGQLGDQGGDSKQTGSGISGSRGGGEGPAKKQKELGDEMPDVILDFGYESGKVYADIMFPKESKDMIRLFMDLDVNLNSSNMIIARNLFAGWLRDVVKKSKKDQQEINLYVFARVFHGKSVLYRMVYYFRECLIGALKDTSDKRIKIHWYDKLFDNPDDIEKYRGKPVLPPKFDKKFMPKLA